VTEYANLSSPEDISARVVYEMFGKPSRTYAIVHGMYGIIVMVMTFYTIFQKRGVTVFLGQEISTLMIMIGSFKWVTPDIKGEGGRIREYAYVN